MGSGRRAAPLSESIFLSLAHTTAAVIEHTHYYIHVLIIFKIHL
jgi:hypothetical protein